MSPRVSLPSRPAPEAASAALSAAGLLRLQQQLALADTAGLTPPLQASAAAREALALATQGGLREEAARAGLIQCVQLLRLGRHAQVLAEAPAADQALQALPQDESRAHQRLELLRVLSLSACELARFDVALDAAHQAVQIAQALQGASAALKSAFALGVCFERMGDSWQAQRVLATALQRHADSGVPAAELVVMRNALCAISIGLFHRLNGAAPQAETDAVLARALDAGTQALQGLADPPDPLQEVAICGNVGEVLMYQGQMLAAQALLRRSEATARARGYSAYLWRLTTTMAVWDLLQGHPEAALARMAALIAEMAETAGQPPQQTAIRAHHAAYRACRQLGRFEQALQHFETVERLERERATDQLRAQSQLLVTRTEAQQALWLAEQAREDAQTQRARAAEFAAHAERDALTGLGNRRQLDRRCAELLPALERDAEPAALVLIDVDHFKLVNDAYGHAVGDRVLVALAALLRENTRSRDVLARYGGEEFVALLPGMGLTQAAEVCERLRERVAAHTGWCAEVPELRLTISLGLAAVPPYDLHGLLKWADGALYRAKRSGRNRLCVAPARSATAG